MNEELARRAKRYAKRQGRTFTDLVADAVSEFISRPAQSRPRERITLPTSGSINGSKFTDADYRAIIDRMYEEEAAHIMKGLAAK
jgi:hypothetical protein